MAIWIFILIQAALNYYACMAETSPVRRGTIVMIFRENGRAQIVNDQFSIMSGDIVEKRTIETIDDFNVALSDVFGISKKVDGKEVF